MTAQRNLKQIIRDRQHKTGESYTAARAQVLASGPGPHTPSPTIDVGTTREAVILKVNRDSARVRIPGEAGQITFRSSDVWEAVPGHLATLIIERRWTWRGDSYASGQIEDLRIDVTRLGLVPLPLALGEPEDLRRQYEPYRNPDPYAPMWRRNTAKPRVRAEFDPIAWGSFPDDNDDDLDDNATCRAADLAAAGDVDGARELLMNTLLRDLRCIDAHAHLGSLEFDRSPRAALVHYEVGVGIAELSLPPGFDGVLLWGRIYNRPYLRALHGQGLCLWRLGRFEQALEVFDRILAFNPNDNQGVRFIREDVLARRSWESTRERRSSATS
jgi:hypothetical protein